MLIYSGTKENFMIDIDQDILDKKLFDAIKDKMNRTTGEAEIRSWKNSLKEMYITLNDSTIPNDTGIAIEYNIPQTSKRIDFLLSGIDKSNKPNVIIVELKQWDKISLVPHLEDVVETYVAGAMRYVVHPSYQVWSYSQLIADYNQYVQDKEVGLVPCVYLHNYKVSDNNDPLYAEQFTELISKAPTFTHGQKLNLRKYIKEHIHVGDNSATIKDIENGKIRPSKQLQDSLAKMLKGNKEFLMIDEQKVIYENILHLSDLCKKDNKKRTIIIEGGPGTGKSVVAINLLAELTQRNQLVQYVSKNSAPRQVYKSKLKGNIKSSTVDNMFKGSGCYVDVPINYVDTILVDEAHRLNAKSGMFANLGENQIKEIIQASKCSVFFIDENQQVTIKDIGSINEIEHWAKIMHSEIHHHKLHSQFRCNGSDGYLAWLDNVLEIRDTANYDLNGIDYDIRICSSPFEMQQLILERNNNNKARILAGYCWEWPKNTRNDSNYHDITIGDFGISWNLGDSQTFAIDKNSVHEAGCIHTSQGLEFDYVGVIIGNDLRYEDGHVIADYRQRASSDQSLKGIKGIAKKDPARADRIATPIIKNTYRTLLTRGMKGCFIYCTDQALANYLKSRINTNG